MKKFLAVTFLLVSSQSFGYSVRGVDIEKTSKITIRASIEATGCSDKTTYIPVVYSESTSTYVVGRNLTDDGSLISLPLPNPTHTCQAIVTRTTEANFVVETSGRKKILVEIPRGMSSAKITVVPLE